MADVPDHIHKLAATHCEPLFLSLPFIGNGHNADKANGTITFIEYKRRIFGVTCAHIYDEQIPSGKWLTLHGSKNYAYQLATFTPEGYISLFRPLRDRISDRGPDIAIIELGESVREIHFERKGKQAINLDNWVEPNWSEITVPVAFGYPTEHKSKSENDISSPLIAVAAEATRPITETDESFLLASSLEVENTFFFSGMSGGPVYHVPDSDAAPIIIGIVFEGVPGSSKEWESRDEQSFLTSNDIQIRAHTLTPKVFDQWLRQARFL